MDKTNYQEYSTLREKMMVANPRVSMKSLRLLFRLSRYFKPKTILSTGTTDEISTSCLAMGSPDTRFINFPDKLSPLADCGLIDMIFIAGDHPKDILLDYFFRILQHIHNDSVLIFYNIHGSGEINEVWNEIKNHSSVTLTIDLFDLGLVFYKEELTREDFILRY